MTDLKGLLNSLLGGDIASSVTQTAQNAQGAASGAISDLQARMQGTQAGDAFNKAKQMAADNPTATVAAAGGLAALLLGTSAGRQGLGAAVKLGGLAALGGLAYKAFTNYQQGKPLTAGIPGLEQSPAPAASGFRPEELGEDSSRIIMRAMIATAAADGVVDASERATIFKDMHQVGVDAEATAFLENEIKRPATVAEITAAVGNRPQLAAQVYAACSLAASADSPQEMGFLANLATGLGLNADLVAHLRDAMPGVPA